MITFTQQSIKYHISDSESLTLRLHNENSSNEVNNRHRFKKIVADTVGNVIKMSTY